MMCWLSSKRKELAMGASKRRSTSPVSKILTNFRIIHILCDFLHEVYFNEIFFFSNTCFKNVVSVYVIYG